MALSALDDKSTTPQEDELAETLKRTNKLWNKLKADLASQYEPLTETWKFYSTKSGWSLQLKRQKRTVLYLIPCKGYFLAALVLGEKAVKAAHESDLPLPILDDIASAKKYVEGRSIRIEVRRQKDLGSVKQIAAIKMAN